MISKENNASSVDYVDIMTTSGGIELILIPSLAAIIIFRLPWTWKTNKLIMKFIHAGFNLAAFICATISFVAVFDFHNAAKIPNMYSLHSWLGLAALILFALQVHNYHMKLFVNREEACRVFLIKNYLLINTTKFRPRHQNHATPDF